MSKRTTSGSSKVAEEGQPFIPATEMNEDDIVPFDEAFFKHARIRRGDVILREATGRLTKDGIVPFPGEEEQ